LQSAVQAVAVVADSRIAVADNKADCQSSYTFVSPHFVIIVTKKDLFKIQCLYLNRSLFIALFRCLSVGFWSIAALLYIFVLREMIKMTHDNIYMVNSAATAVPANANIPLGNIVRRYGCACNGTSNAVTLKECGYYQVDFNITYTGAAGAAAFAIQKNGTTINGAVASQTITTASTEINTAKTTT
jgi:hypothetical protein